MDWNKVAALGLPALKQLATDLPSVPAKITDAKTKPWWPAVVALFPNIDKLDDATVRDLGELSGFLSEVEPVLALLA